MPYTPNQIAEGISIFVESEMLPALSGWKVWAGAAALSLAGRNIAGLLDASAKNPAVSALGLMDDSGLIDAEAAAMAIKDAIRAHGKLPVNIPLLDTEFCFAEKDVDTLLSCVKQAAGAED